MKDHRGVRQPLTVNHIYKSTRRSFILPVLCPCWEIPMEINGWRNTHCSHPRIGQLGRTIKRRRDWGFDFFKNFLKQSLVGNNLTLINDFNVQCKLQLANHMQVKWLFLGYGHLMRDKYSNFLWFFVCYFCLCIWMKNLKRLERSSVQLDIIREAYFFKRGVYQW